MADKFHEIVFTDSVRKAQEHYYGKSQRVEDAPERDALTEDETGFIQARDSFYMATVSETGWPYVQHRGGKPGFLRVLNPTALAFADYKGNRQLLSTGNLAVDRPGDAVPDGLSAAHAAENPRSRPRRRRATASRTCRATRRAGSPAPRGTVVLHRSRFLRLELPAIHHAALYRRRSGNCGCPAETTHRRTGSSVESK